MIILNGSSDTLQAFMGEAVTTTNPDFFVSWADFATTFAADRSSGALNGVTDVTMVSGSATNKRLIRTIQICNVDTVEHAITVQYNDGTNDRVLAKAVPVPAGKTLVWAADTGWVIQPASETFGSLTIDGDTNANLFIDKNGVADDAVAIFRTNGSTRAEVGLVGNDDLTLRVSADGSTFTDAVFIDKDNGNVGIGTNSPNTLLDVQGGTITLRATDGGRLIELTDLSGAANNGGIRVYNDAGAEQARISSVTSSWVPLNFGIGTTSPSVRLDVQGGSSVFGAPTGGAKGTGTINCKAAYDDNNLLTDLVLDYFVDGKFDAAKYENHPLAGKLTPEWFDPDWYAEFWKLHRHLPGMISWDDEENRPSVGEVCTRLTAVVETLVVHIDLQNQRIRALENRGQETSHGHTSN